MWLVFGVWRVEHLVVVTSLFVGLYLPVKARTDGKNGMDPSPGFRVCLYFKRSGVRNGTTVRSVSQAKMGPEFVTVCTISSRGTK